MQHLQSKVTLVATEQRPSTHNYLFITNNRDEQVQDYLKMHTPTPSRMIE